MKKLIATLALTVCAAFTASAENFVNLSTVSGDMVVTDGSRLHAMLNDKGKISIAPNATVTLWLAIIQGSATKTGAGITCQGNATIILEGENYVCGRSSGFPAIYVPKGSTLTIKGTGKLTAIGNGWAAGIGGGDGQDCGNIVIDGGVITAQGGDYDDDGSITFITDDMILPPDSNYKKNSLVIHPPSVNGGGPGIGAAQNGSCGDITFNRGNVTAYGYRAPAIGRTSSDKECGTITINQGIGKVEAIVKKSQEYYNVVCVSTTSNINKANDVTASATENDSLATVTYASPLGALSGNKTYKNKKHEVYGDITDIQFSFPDDGLVKPDGHGLGESHRDWINHYDLPCLKGGLSGNYRISIEKGATIALKNVTIGPSLTSDMPGITCNGDATIVLYGDNYVAGHGEQYPGIFVPQGHTLTIKGSGSLTAVGGGDYGVGIGSCGPKKERGGSVDILSGNITAIGGKYASALGGSFLVQDGDDETIEEHAEVVRIKNGTVHTKGGISRDTTNHFVVDASLIERTAKGDEEFFRWNGNLDGLPMGPWIYAVAHDKTTVSGGPFRPDDETFGYVPIVTIAPDAEVCLNDVHICADTYRSERVGYVEYRKARNGKGLLQCAGNASIKLIGNNNLVSAPIEYTPGIYVPEGTTLTFTGDGALDVNGGRGAAGIGSYSQRENCGSIVFNGGNINVYGSPDKPSHSCWGRPIGVPGGGDGKCGDIVFNKGSISLYVVPEYVSQGDISLFDGSLWAYVGDDSKTCNISIGRGMVKDSIGGVGWETEWYSIFGGFEEFVRCSITWDGNLDDLGEEEDEGSGIRMMATSALPKLKSAKLLGAGDPWSGDLEEEVLSEAIAGDGTVISGTLSGRHKISIAPDATVILRDATIWPTSSNVDSPYAGLTCLGNATIILEGENYIASFNDYFPAIRAAEGGVLTIEGAGKLFAQGGSYAAAIGGPAQRPCGSIVVNGGYIEATGGTNGGAGIGSGYDGSCSNITLGAGIAYLRAYGYGPAHIGRGGNNGTSGRVSYSLALDKTYDDEGYEVYRWNGNLAKALSDPGDSVALTALDGTTMTGSNLSQGVYKKVKVMIAPGAKVTLNAVTIDGSLQNLPDSEFLGTVAQWAGITCLGDAEITLVESNRVDTFNCEYPCVYVPPRSTLKIKGSGTLMADNTRAHARGAGIGGGSRVGINSDCGTIIIDGGTVHGYSSGYSTDSGYTDGLGYSAGIGSGPGGWCEGIEIGAGITEVRGWNKAGSGTDRPSSSAEPIGGGAGGGVAYVSPAHGLTDNYIGTWADRVFRSIPRVDLSQATGDVTITMDSIVTGRLPGNGQYKVTIAANAEVTLKDVTIYGKGAGIYCAGNASVWLEGTNSVFGESDYPGIYVPQGWYLNIYANTCDGYLSAEGGTGAAGIGSGKGSTNCRESGRIWIHGGQVIATGGEGGAEIGSGLRSSGGDSTCEAVGIDGGSVLAKSNGYGAGIGSGYQSTCGSIYIGPEITRVRAVRGSSSSEHIGSGQNGSCGTPDIDDSLRDTTVGNSRTLEYNPDIDLDPFYIPDTSELLVLDTAVVSGTLRSNVKRPIVIEAGATVTLSNVTITGTNDSNCEWAGITCLGDATIILEGTNNITGYYEDYPGIYVPPYSTLTIKGDGVLNASGSVGSQSQRWAPGIGGGYELDGGNIVIEGGKITATGGKYAAGIGGGSDASFGTIEINGGSVASLGGLEATGIGSGYGGSCEGVSIGKGILFVSATGDVGGTATVAPIGPSLEGSCARTSIAGGLVQVEDGNTLTIMPAKMNLGKVIDDVIVQNGMTLTGTLAASCKISIAPDARITLKDAVIPGTDKNIGDAWAGLTCISNATITLEGTSTVRCYGSSYRSYPGIYVPEGATLTIQGSGSLTAETDTNNWSSAGIGGGSQSGTQHCGNITIAGGRVTARGYHSGVGIGGGVGGSCGMITIGAGVVEVTAMCGIGMDHPIGAGQSWPTPAVIEVDPSLNDTTSLDGLTRTIKPPDTVDLSMLTENHTFQNRETITGIPTDNLKFSIAAGATVTLRDVMILGENEEDYKWAGLNCLGDATIILEGENIVNGFYEDYPGIHVPVGCTLTIKGSGSLEASGSVGTDNQRWAAGIGGGYNISCGNIVIEGGTITATGGSGAAGIGGAGNNYQATRCGDITITESVTCVTATKGQDGVRSIGRGLNGQCGTVTIGGVEGEISISPFVYRPWNGDLTTLDSDVTVKDGTIITGTLDGDHVISLEDGATNYLYNATINGKLVCKGNATIVISGDNTITATDGAAISVPSGYHADIIGNGTLLAIGTEEISGVIVDGSLDYETSDNDKTLMVAPKASVFEAAMLEPYTEWATANGIVGAWDARDANGVANVFRYAFDKADDADFTENDIILDFATDGAGMVAIQTLPVVNGKRLFSFTIIASDNADGTGNVAEYPLSLESDGITYIDEEYNPSRFFRIRIDVK